jgi:hypothetical protein
MATVEAGLKAFIEASAASVSGPGYPMQVPQKVGYPAWAYEVINDLATIAHSGRVVLRKATIQITLVCKTYADVSQARTTLQGLLDGYKGDLGGVAAQFCKTTVSDNWADIHQLPVARLDVTIVYKP